jgi:elongation factor Ts
MNLCLHLTANAPAYITSADVPADVIAKEREIAASQPELAGKPEKILEGILRGKINKFYTQVCLMEQPWIDDEKTTLAKVAPKLVVKRFIRWQVGEEVK